MNPTTTFENLPFEKMFGIAEKFYGTSLDPDQIPINSESLKKLQKISPYCFNCALDGNHNPVSWVVCIPTTKSLMGDFISNKITEKQMFDQTPISTPPLVNKIVLNLNSFDGS